MAFWWEVGENGGKYSPEAGIMCLTKHAWNGTLKRNQKNPGNNKKENESKWEEGLWKKANERSAVVDVDWKITEKRTEKENRFMKCGKVRNKDKEMDT